jgi:hypothetical protein
MQKAHFVFATIALDLLWRNLKKMSDDSLDIGPILVVAVVLIAFLLWKFWDDFMLRFRATKTTGTITNWMSRSEKGKVYFYPLITFTTEDGASIQFRADESCEDNPLYPRGTEVTVSYLPKKPSVRKVEYP